MDEILIADLTLDTFQRNKIPPLIIPQHDYGARHIRVRITEQGRKVSVDSGAVVSIIATRRGDGQEAAFSGSVNADGSVLVPVVQWMLDVPRDDVDCHVVVTGIGYQYATTSFSIVPQERANPTDLSDDDPRVDIITEALKKSVEEADRAADQASMAQSAASRAASDATAAAEDEVTRLVGQLGVVQVLGNSRTSVVSQALTTALYNRTSKRITNLERGVAEQFETDASVAHVKDVPDDALPYAEIKKVGGMTYKDGDTLRSAAVTDVESVGVNLFDGEILKGYYSGSDGNYVYYENEGCSKNYISILPNTQYCVAGAQNYVLFYDFNQKFISSLYYNSQPFATPANARYMRLNFGTADISKITVNKGTTALPYTPYVRHTLPIPAEVQALDGYGWGVNADCYNYIDWEKKRFVKRVGCVDLGTVYWSREDRQTYIKQRFVCYSIPNIKNATGTSLNVLCSKYATNTAPISGGDKDMTIAQNGNAVYVLDSTDAYTDATTFKAAMSGVMLYYELATPEITDISDLITVDNFIEVEGSGTLTFKNEYKYAIPSKVEYQVEV